MHHQCSRIGSDIWEQVYVALSAMEKWSMSDDETGINLSTLSLGAGAYGNRCLHVGNIAGFGRMFL